MKQKHGVSFKDIKQLLVLLRPLIPHMILTITLGVLGYLAITSITVLGGMAILQWSGLGEYAPITLLIGGVIAAGVLRAIFRLSEQYSTHYIAFRILAIVRDQIFSKLRKLSNQQIQSIQKGELMNVVTKDVELLEVFYAHTIAPVCIGVVTSAIYIGILSSFHPLYGVAGFIAYIVISYCIPKAVYSYGERAGEKYREGFAGLSNFLMDSLKGMKELLVFGAQKRTLETIDDYSEQLNDTTLELKKHEGLLKAATDIGLYCMVFLQIALSIYLYNEQRVTASEGLLALLVLFASFGPSLALSQLSASLVHTFASAKSVLQLLNIQPQIQVSGMEAAGEVHELSFHNVAFGYNEQQTLYKHVNMNWSKGKIIGIKGKNGVGKSTLISLLFQDISPTSGTIKLNGRDIQHYSKESLLEQFSVVDAKTTVFSDTLRHNITLYQNGYSDEEILVACQKAGLNELIQSLPEGLDTYMQEFAGNFSSGQVQRLALARLFLKNSSVYILDEPTSNLDALNEKHILKSLKMHADDKLIVLISHSDSVLALADEMYHIEDGKISVA